MPFFDVCYFSDGIIGKRIEVHVFNIMLKQTIILLDFSDGNAIKSPAECTLVPKVPPTHSIIEPNKIQLHSILSSDSHNILFTK